MQPHLKHRSSTSNKHQMSKFGYERIYILNVRNASNRWSDFDVDLVWVLIRDLL